MRQRSPHWFRPQGKVDVPVSFKHLEDPVCVPTSWPPPLPLYKTKLFGGTPKMAKVLFLTDHPRVPVRGQSLSVHDRQRKEAPPSMSTFYPWLYVTPGFIFGPPCGLMSILSGAPFSSPPFVSFITTLSSHKRRIRLFSGVLPPTT